MVQIDFNKLRFLVVDDNLHMRRILRTLLHGFGARDVMEAEDGAAGLEMFSSGNPDIVFLDWEMPIFRPGSSDDRQPGVNSNPFVPVIATASPSVPA
jgi:CheY-like chemotaxis protein